MRHSGRSESDNALAKSCANRRGFCHQRSRSRPTRSTYSLNDEKKRVLQFSMLAPYSGLIARIGCTRRGMHPPIWATDAWKSRPTPHKSSQRLATGPVQPSISRRRRRTNTRFSPLTRRWHVLQHRYVKKKQEKLRSAFPPEVIRCRSKVRRL